MKKNTGFTLVELMITLAIVGILLVVGVPSLKSFMQSNQLVAASNELVSAIHVARSEAIKQNAAVTVCESSDGKNCATSGDWKNGWIVFVDSDYNLKNTGAVCSAADTDCLLRVNDGFDNSQLQVNGLDSSSLSISSITFTSRGLPLAASGSSTLATFSVCTLDDGGSTTASRAVVLSLAGRVRVSDNSAVIKCP